MTRLVTTDEKETLALGRRLGKLCRGGEVFALCGHLGAGKTKLLQGLAAGLGVAEPVNSPTFNILKLYAAKRGRIRSFCHIDAYRLSSERSLAALGVAEFFADKSCVTAIEWGERVKKIWPRGTRVIRIRALKDGRRQISSSGGF